jgi:hypothetical protein
VPLTDKEKTTIACRAAGSYAVIPSIRRIVRDQAKNRTPEDQVFLDFARLILKKSFRWEDYEPKARAVLAIIPEPFGPCWSSKISNLEPPVEEKPKKRRNPPRKNNNRNKPPKGEPPRAGGIDDLFRLFGD